MRKIDQFDYYRSYYSVPVLRGVRVRCASSGEVGVIASASNAFRGIRVCLEETISGQMVSCPYLRDYRPEELLYLPTKRQLALCHKKRREYWAMVYPEFPYPSEFTFERIGEVAA